MVAGIVPYVWYPAFVTAAIATFALLLSAGASSAVAAYVPTVAVAVAIVLLEMRFAERREWRPRWDDVKADAAFMALVQVALPQLLAFLCALAIAAWMHEHAPSSWWPHDWPLAAQILATVLIVDFTRYWLHRACHKYDVLWRLHEVHHSPDILYILNVARFHPFEKVLHFSLDTVPFLLLGVAPEVIAGYFLVYSVNGFFQHSNLRLRHGWLNYAMASAEIHRWHHARNPRTAQCNFSNTTIVWDLLFGTRYLPQEQLTDVGIMDRKYPKDFLSQMLTPFQRRTVSGQGSGSTPLANVLIALKLRWTGYAHRRRLARAACDPMRVQRALLLRILHENRDTVFGREHDFAGIDSCDSYARHVPVCDYEALRPYIEREMARGEPTLTASEPVLYARTSGTTGKPKDIPLTSSYLRALQRVSQAAVAAQYRICPQAFAGGIVVIVSPAREGVLANGKPYGSASGMVAGNTPALVRGKFIIPACVLTVSDSRAKYLLILRLALGRRDVTYLGAANPTTLLTLIKLYREYQRELIDDVRNGGFFLASSVPAEVLRSVRTALRADPQRATGLSRLQRATTPPRIADLWPELRLVVTWTCASAGIAADALRRELGPHTHVHELGYIASEFRGTVTLGHRPGSGLPTFDTHFFEFVERDKWDRGEPEFMTLDQLRKGVTYYVIVTTPSGLYRYFVNDLLRVHGFFHRTPLLKFVQKGKGVTNITGEKLYEAQVLNAVRSALADIGRDARFVMMLADDNARRYDLYIEPDSGLRPAAAEFAATVDRKLMEMNIEYQAKRESGRLPPLRAWWLLPDTGEAYKQYCVAKGQREGQFKLVALAYVREFGFDLRPHAREW